MKNFLFATALLIATAITADAQPVARHKVYRQEQRIHQGHRSGQLTRAEAARLQRRQSLIRRDVRRARADGYVTARERATIRQRQALASRSIYRQKHDRQIRR
jgi:uncharacterized membrane protein YebE (DUF533 family)